MEILTKESFERGCQFQIIGASNKHHLYISEYNSVGHFVLFDYEFACEYGKYPWHSISLIHMVTPDFFVFQYKVLGEIENLKRYYNQFQVVKYAKHLY